MTTILQNEAQRFQDALTQLKEGKTNIYLYGLGSNGKTSLMKHIAAKENGWTSSTGSVETWKHSSGRCVYISNNLEDLNCVGQPHVFHLTQTFK